MARLTSPAGAVVSVSDDKAARLTAIGYVAEKQDEPKAPAKKSASSKSSK